MRLIAITWPTIFDGESDIINEMFARGLECLHVRKPDAAEENVNTLICQIEPVFRARIAIHYSFNLAERFGLGGVHLNKRCPEAPEGWRGRVSSSCHSLDEVVVEKGARDYVFLSPIFDSISKKGYASGFSREELERARDEGIIDEKVVALGGIREERIEMVRQLGFGGVAVLGGLWGKDALERYERLREVCG